MAEYNFDGLVGPTHNYAGLAKGNLASMSHAGLVSNPRAAALQGIAKMHRVWQLGVGQAVLPPHERPAVSSLRRLGFAGSDAQVVASAARHDDHLLRLCSSASAMWTANAATVAPGADTEDARLHLTPANLTSMFHRSIETATTTRVLRALFADRGHFVVHDPLPGGEHFSDEGAANHTRLFTDQAAVQLFAWGKSSWGSVICPTRYPARQSQEASVAIARSHQLRPHIPLFWQQAPRGLDGGAFHTDVLAVGNTGLLILHEHAFVDSNSLLAELRQRLGPQLEILVASDQELPLADAVKAYPFNSQLLTTPQGRGVIVAPTEAEQLPTANRFLQRVQQEATQVDEIVYLDVNASMNNGGGPACLRLRIELTDAERQAVRRRVFFDDALHRDLVAWVTRHYRDRLLPADLADPQLLIETRTGLDELTQLLQLGTIYDFQGADPAPH